MAKEKTATDISELVGALRLHLSATREKLMLVNPDILDDAEHDAWAEQVYTVSLAIIRLRNLDLGLLAAQFKKELPDLERATDRLTEDLYGLKKAVDVINAVSQTMGIITKIISLT